MKRKTIIDKESFLILLLFGVTTIIYFSNMSIGGTDDTRLWVDNSELALTSLEFWASEYFPILLPLVLKWLNRDVLLVVLLQVLVSLTVWYWLIVTFLGSIKHQIVRFLAIVLLAGFALSIDVFGWNWLILSESLHNSMLVLYLTATYGFYRHLGQDKQRKYSIAILLSSILFCAARDIGMYLVLIVSLAFLFEWIVLAVRKVKKSSLLINAIVGFLVFATFQTIVSYQSRGTLPLLATISIRLTEPEFRNYFVDRGMPLQTNELSINTQDVLSTKEVEVLMKSAEFKEWFAMFGKKTFVGFLLSRPVRSLSEIFFSTDELRTIFDEPLGYYMGVHQEENVLPGWYLFLERTVLFPRGYSYLLFSVGTAVCLIYLVMCGAGVPVQKLAIVMLVASIMLAFMLGHVATGEPQRVTLIVKLMTRLAFFLIILTTIDIFLSKKLFGKRLTLQNHTNSN